MQHVAWTVVATELGPLLVAATPRGVCRVAFGETEAALGELVARDFPVARLARGEAGVAPLAAVLERSVAGDAATVELPLDVAASAFRRRVYEALRAIPRGEVRSYGEVARALGMPAGARAVACACAANPVALAIPCHRVVAQRGGPGGYRWGAERKRLLLARERARPGS